MKRVKIPTLAWYGDVLKTLTFPDNWEIMECGMVGNTKHVLADWEIKAAFEKPLGIGPISEMAKNKRDVVVIFDDMTRGTPVARIIPHVINELKESGISKDRIRFIMALGAHGARNRMDFVKKLGTTIVEKYAIYNHNPFENCKHIGKTSNGTPLEVNKEVMKCDLKIGIGSIVPHSMAGFGGGSKIILPGVTSMKTIHYNHCVLGGYGPKMTPHKSTGLGLYEDNVIYSDAEEAAQIAGLDVKVDALINERREIVGLFVGEPTEQRKRALEIAKEHYLTYPAEDCDVVVTNCYTKANEAETALWAGVTSVRSSGTIVLISQTPEGQVTHYLYGKFGRKIGGRGWEDKKTMQKVGKLIVYSPYKEVDPLLPFWCEKNRVAWTKTWKEVIKKVSAVHKGSLRVAVYPCAEIQYPPVESAP